MLEKLYDKIGEIAMKIPQCLYEVVNNIANRGSSNSIAVYLGSTFVILSAGIYSLMFGESDDLDAFMSFMESESIKLQLSKEFTNTFIYVSSMIFVGMVWLFILSIYLIWRVKYFTGLRLAYHIRENEQKISLLQFTCERLLDQEQEMYENAKRAIFEDLSLVQSEFNNKANEKWELITKSMNNFNIIYKESFTAFDTQLSNLNKEKQTLEKLLNTNKLLQETNTKRLSDIDGALTAYEDNLARKIKHIQDLIDPLIIKVNQLRDNVPKTSELLQKEFDITKLQVYKSTIMLIDSQILFDAAVSKFEVINSKIDAMLESDTLQEETGASVDANDAQKRLEQCLVKAVETRKRFCESSDTMLALPSYFDENTETSAELISTEESKFEGFMKEIYKYSRATDYTLKQLLDTTEKLDSEQKHQISRYNELKQRLQDLQNANQKHYIEQDCNKQLISTLFSVLYSLIITNTNHLIENVHNNSAKISKTLDELQSLILNNVKGAFFESGYEFVELCKSLCYKNIHEFKVLVFEFCIIQIREQDIPDISFSKELYNECSKKSSESFLKLFDCFFQCSKPPGILTEDWKQLKSLVYDYKNMLVNEVDNICKEFYSDFIGNINEFSMVLRSVGDLEQPNDDIINVSNETTLNLYYNTIESPLAINSVQSIVSDSGLNYADQSSLSADLEENVQDSDNNKPLHLVEKFMINSSHQ